MRSKASLQLMELLVMILVFALAAALCLQVFAKASEISQDTARYDQAVILPSAARDAEIKQSVEMELANFSPETSIPDPVMVDEIEKTQPSTTVESPTIRCSM